MTTRILRGPVTCVGVHILDILGRPVSEIPPGQHSVLIEEIRVTAAGTAAGTSVDLAKLGGGVRNVGAIGDDVLGDFVLRLLDDYGVDTRLITRFESTRTSATMLPIRPNGERPALHMQGANGDFTAAHLTADQLSAITGAALVHLGGIDAMTNLDPGSVGEWAASAKKNGALITMDVLRNGDSRTLEALEPILRHTDWFCPNDEQLQTLTGENDIGKAARRVLAMGAGGIAVTQGEKGCRLIDGEIDVTLPALDVRVVDTTGCGDGFDAGFITGLLAGLSPVQSGWVGTVCGSLVATGLGSDAGIVDLDQVASILSGLDSDDAREGALVLSSGQVA
jgi:sugar/nucleoside kinase (ribokinase family)